MDEDSGESTEQEVTATGKGESDRDTGMRLSERNSEFIPETR